jgi:hypothetical protein
MAVLFLCYICVFVLAGLLALVLLRLQVNKYILNNNNKNKNNYYYYYSTYA